MDLNSVGSSVPLVSGTLWDLFRKLNYWLCQSDPLHCDVSSTALSVLLGFVRFDKAAV